VTLETIDIAIIAVYAVSLLGIALFVSREPAGHDKDTEDYFLAGRALPWWAIGASLIASNISAEQIIGQSGQGFAIGIAITAYEWQAAIVLIIVAKFFLPIFLKRKIYTMPQFLDQRYGHGVKTLMSVYWVALYTAMNLTGVLWLGGLAVSSLTGFGRAPVDDGARRFRGALFALWRSQGGGSDRYNPGRHPDPRRARDHVGCARCPSCRRSARRLRLSVAGDAGSLRDDPRSGRSGLREPARHLDAARRAVGAAFQLFGIQPVHHPARARGRESAKRKRGSPSRRS
jgi:hypothetical protein